ncbi:redoxin domain-containing protein [Dactylosporangium fulvum]|uniref:Redoxin domain-containing protein n=1 Tax=Dactylosporangium fulvum TaxID=53359 RepID=A0ABY5VXW7_9ACTN|nr:redoxin domain-containing protein [Dactylosporangium fulvum]UWP82562.1 redoxin domain-containing protein [Dactylosporangium fulvum]
MSGPLPQPGQRAPDFELPAGPDAHKVGTTQFRGRPTVLAFYPADWSPVCSDQMSLYSAVMPEFERYNAGVLGISVDGVWSHKAFAEDRGIHFPLLADFEPKGAVARDYGVYDESTGMCERALFVLDADGVVVWSHVSPPGTNPGADGILNALEGLDSERRPVL